MCGILGCIGVFDRTQCEAVMSSLRVRGPDGVYIISNNKFYLGLSRLAIVSPEDQCLPFADSTNNIHCVVNGEIYNYRELRSKLTKLGHNFITEIDTEVVLHAFLTRRTNIYLIYAHKFLAKNRKRSHKSSHKNDCS